MGFLPLQGGWRMVDSECKRQGRSQIQGKPRALDGQPLTLSFLVTKMPRAGCVLSPVSQEGQVLPCVSHSAVSSSLWPLGLYPTWLLCPWDFPGKKTGVGCHSLLQEIFWTQGSNPCLFSCPGRQIPYQLSHRGSPWDGLTLSVG